MASFGISYHFFLGGAKNSQNVIVKTWVLKVLKKIKGVKWKILPRTSGILWNNSITQSYWKVRSP